MKKESFRELITLWTYSSDAFLILDNNANILYANPVLEQVSGLEMKRQVDRNIRDLLNDGLINNSASLGAIKHNSSVTREITTSAGKQLLSTASPVKSTSGEIYRIVCNIRNKSIVPQTDITEVKNKIPSYSYKNIKIDEKYELAFKSKTMSAVLDTAYNLSSVDSTVLIHGETGVGKELIARLIHYNSLKGHYGNFIKLNCGALPANLIESELFGYEPGAFTGALKSGKMGYLELAKGGTLFLDEISELPMELQPKLLGVLQDSEFYKIGGNKPKDINVRIITATNQDLEQLVKQGKFRKDLYYRLNVIPVRVPPLRERKEDIPALASHFSDKLKERYGIEKEISPEMIDYLYEYNWPGNVRELESLLERLLITVPHSRITESELPLDYSLPSSNNYGDTLKEKVEKFELEIIKDTIENSKSNAEAAKKLGISLSSLFRKIKKLEERADF